MALRFGTANFVSRAHAISYYRDYDRPDTYADGAAMVDRRVAEGSIHIGAPEVPQGYRLVTIDAGKRYALEEIEL